MRHAIGKINRERGAARRLVSVAMLMAMLVCLLCLGVLPVPAQAADFSGASEFKLTLGSAQPLDYFGYSVAISGDTAVVGACQRDIDLNAHRGAAYVFTRSESTWPQQPPGGALIAGDGAAEDFLGYSVAISGDTVVVGAPFHRVGSNELQGSAYVFVRAGTNWSQQAQLTATDGAAGDAFGWAVAFTGDTAVIGAQNDTVGANADQGSAYVFVRSGSTWSQQAQLTAIDGAAGDAFGCSVAFTGDTAVVGALTDTVGANGGQGSAYVFVRSGSTWSQQAQLNAIAGGMGDEFGSSVAISGDTLVIGALTDTVGANGGQGSAYVFVRSGSTWSQQAQLNASDGAANDRFGCSVAISGDTAVVGALTDTVGVNAGQGSAYVFLRSGSTWSQQVRLNAIAGGMGDEFGSSVAISGDTLVIGARGDASGWGSAYIYEPVQGAPAQIAATVTLQAISVTVSPGYPTEVSYGVMATSAQAEPVTYTPGSYRYLRVENDGSGAEDLLIKGANATCGAGTWTLAATPGANQYSHLYGIGQAPTTYSALSTAASPLVSDVAVGVPVDFNLKIQTPTTSSVWGQYSTTVIILAVATSSP
jgi:hypothetical protein